MTQAPIPAYFRKFESYRRYWLAQFMVADALPLHQLQPREAR
jgi:hypothetical protein